MKLNAIEKFLMNNPLRAYAQNKIEAGMFEKFGGKTPGQKVLEIGCGRGVGTKIILERFAAGEVHAFDLDPHMIRLAEMLLAGFCGENLRLYVGDAEKIAAPDDFYDAVFDFGIVHHVPRWQESVAEVARVLKPGGKFYFEEVTQRALNRWFYRAFLEHPKENRFSGEQFIAELEKNGIEVGRNFDYWFFDDLLVGVGRKKGRRA